jgi:radial spoke head protein 4/6
VQEDNEREIDKAEPADGEEEVKIPSTSEMVDAAMWVHAKENILLNGSTQHKDPEPAEGEEDFDEEKAKKAQQERDPYEPRLKPLTGDSDIWAGPKMSVPAWQVRACGDQTELADPENPKKIVNNGTILVRSNVWPGAYSFFFQGRVYQIYLGNGHKFEPRRSIYPCHPPQVMSDVAEFADQPEPNPLKEPVVEVKVEEVPGEEGEEE